MIIVSADWKPMNAIHQQLMLFLYQWEHVINAYNDVPVQQ